MIVRKIDSQAFQKSKRQGLSGKSLYVKPENCEKGFEQYLIEAFQGELVKEDQGFSAKLSPLARKNLLRLG